MKALVASLALVIAFCGLAIAQVAPGPPEGPGAQMGPRTVRVRTGDRGTGMGPPRRRKMVEGLGADEEDRSQR